MNKEDFDDLVDSWIHGFVADNQTEEAMRFIIIALLQEIAILRGWETQENENG